MTAAVVIPGLDNSMLCYNLLYRKTHSEAFQDEKVVASGSEQTQHGAPLKGGIMEKTIKLGLAGGMLAVTLLLGGCGAGFHIGKSATPTTAHVSQTTVAQINDTSE